MKAGTFHQSLVLYHYDSVDSTNAEARRLAEQGHDLAPAVIYAHRQVAGRGRYSRPWISDDGNLFVSLLLRPESAAMHLPQLSFVVAIAAAETLRYFIPEHSSHRVSLKWPNDVLLDGRKIAGILLETVTVDTRLYVIAGLGVNIQHAPSHTDYPATYLKMVGLDIISPKIVLSAFLSMMAQEYERWSEQGFDIIRSRWEERAQGIGETISVRTPELSYTGRFEGLAEDGSLLLHMPETGERLTIYAGDIILPQSTHSHATGH